MTMHPDLMKAIVLAAIAKIAKQYQASIGLNVSRATRMRRGGTCGEHCCRAFAAVLAGALALRSKFFWKQSPQSRNLPLFDRGWMTECGTLWSVRFGVAKPAKQDCCLPVLPTQAGYNPLGLMRSVGPTGRRRTILSDDRKHSDLT